MTITLITGANKGLGRETARRLLKVGHTVLVGARDTKRGQRAADDLAADEATQGFGINVFGPIRVMHAFLPLLRASDNPRIVNVSSGAGSCTCILTPSTVENAVTLPVRGDGAKTTESDLAEWHCPRLPDHDE